MLKGEFPNELDGHQFHPNTLMTHAAYAPQWSEGAGVLPIFANSTYLFASAKEAERCFAAMHDPDQDPEDTALAYSRINNPNVEILEKRLALLEGAEAGAVFASGMAAITTLCQALTSRHDLILHTEPLYGGTNGWMKQKFPRFGIHSHGFTALEDLASLLVMPSVTGYKVRLVFIETPSNPTNSLHDIEAITKTVRQYAASSDALVVVDNTFLSPYGQKPLEHGADAVIYSATKSISGHGDVVGGVILASEQVIKNCKDWRSSLGGIMSPFTAWLCMQHLGTLQMRIERMAENANHLAYHLENHNKVMDVFYPPILSLYLDIFEKQCLNGGHMIAFEVEGGKEAAFRVLDNLTIIGHAVSLGGIKSLACHPATTTHGSVSIQDKEKYGISDGLIRLSVGTEEIDDLIWDLDRALTLI